jgi:hypothetical protein
VRQSPDLTWDGEKNRQLSVYRACPCGVCSKSRNGCGFLSCSDANGHGFTVWIENEKVFRTLRRALRHIRNHSPSDQLRSLSKGGPDTPENLRAVCTNCNEGLQNSAPPKPRRIELLKQVRRATIDDQMHLLAWLEKRFEKIRPDKK